MDRWAELFLTVGGQGLSRAAGGLPPWSWTLVWGGAERVKSELAGVGRARDFGGRRRIDRSGETKEESREIYRDHRRKRLGRK